MVIKILYEKCVDLTRGNIADLRGEQNQRSISIRSLKWDVGLWLRFKLLVTASSFNMHRHEFVSKYTLIGILALTSDITW